MRLLVVALALSVGCGGKSSVGADATVADAPPGPERAIPPADGPKPWWCRCGPVTGSKICLQGHVFDTPALLAYWAGLQTLAEILHDGSITTAKDGAVVKVYDPIDFVSNPSGAKPLAEVDIDEWGCFVVKEISIPFSGTFVITVGDPLAGGNKWVFAGMSEVPTLGQNSQDLLLPAVSQQTASDWGHDFLADGTILAVFKHKITDRGMEGVLPTFDGKPPIKDADAGAVAGQWEFEGTPMDVFYMAADPSDSKAIVDVTADKTTKSGVVFVRKAAGTFSGTKTGCTIESGLGASVPSTLFFRIFDVEGC